LELGLPASPFLIIGAGIAGLWTALCAAPRPVVLLTGAKLGDNTSTGWAQGGVAAALGPDDSPSLHAEDTISAGVKLVNKDAAHMLAKAGTAEVNALYDLGAPFERDGYGAWVLSREAAHGIARVARIKGDQAGAGILAVLIRAAKAAIHIEIREGWQAEALLPDAGDGCAGVLSRAPCGALHELVAEHTVLATGSLGGLYAVTTTPWSSQGQALAMAARLGAVIRDCEFIQFHPTAIDIGLDPSPLATEALRGEGAVLVDRKGVRFMADTHPLAELAPRDVVARAVHVQNQSGRGAFLDAREAVGEAFPDQFPAVFAACQSGGIDPRVACIPVTPAAHYHMGGVETDLNGATSAPGLWAVGECACNGLHGANRLASNSLLEGLVFGRRTANAVKAAAPRPVRPRIVQAPPILPDEALQTLRQALSRHAGVVRDMTGLKTLMSTLARMRAQHGDAPALIAAHFVALAGLERTESRGVHFRADHSEPHDQACPSRLTLTDLRNTGDTSHTGVAA